MQIQKGDHVLVNVAPFIGSVRRSKDTVPCRIVDIDDKDVEVCTEAPYREVSLRVLRSWIEGKLDGQSVA
jgi:hypothetical protein